MYSPITALLVVATGIYENNCVTKTEIVDLENPSVSCKPWADSKEVYSATGSFTEIGLVICGGIIPTGNDDIPDLEVNMCRIVGQTSEGHSPLNQIVASGGSSSANVDNETFIITGGMQGKQEFYLS